MNLIVIKMPPLPPHQAMLHISKLVIDRPGLVCSRRPYVILRCPASATSTPSPHHDIVLIFSAGQAL